MKPKAIEPDDPRWDGEPDEDAEGFGADHIVTRRCAFCRRERGICALNPCEGSVGGHVLDPRVLP